MNRTDTAPRVLALLAEEHTINEAAEALELPRTTVQAAIQRLKLKGKLDRREDELGYVRWKAKPERIPEDAAAPGPNAGVAQ